MAKIKVTGLKELQKALKDNVTMDDVKKVVRDNVTEMQRKMHENADFKMGYATGQTKRSIMDAGINIFDNGFSGEAGATTEYAEYLEVGTRFMDAQPFVKPAYDEQVQQFKKDMQRLVK